MMIKKDNVTEFKQEGFNDLRSVCFSGATLKPFFICIVLQFIQHWCGVIVIIFKSIHVFETFQTSLDHNLETVIVGAVALVATICKVTSLLEHETQDVNMFSITDADRKNRKEDTDDDILFNCIIVHG